MTAFVLIFAPLFFGAIDLFWICVWLILLSVGILAGIGTPLSTGQSRMLLAFLLLCAAYVLITVGQVVPQSIDFLNDPIWKRSDELLGTTSAARISSRAEIPYQAIGHVLLFATAFTNGFFVGTSRDASSRLLKLVGYAVVAYVVYGFAALVLMPGTLLWTDKIAYRGSFTSTFVNHNTAATYVGAGLIIWACAAITAVQSIRESSLRTLLLLKSNEVAAMHLIFTLVCALACFFALLKSGSRGGLICSAIGLITAVSLLVASKLKASPLYRIGIVTAGLVITMLLIGRLDRIASQGLFDGGRWSVYNLAVQAIVERPWVGWGNGTFADLFPALRDDSLHSWGVWDLAHSTVLEIAVEMGLPIALVIVTAAIASLVVLVRAAATSDRSNLMFLSVISGVAVLSYLHSMIDFSLQVPGYLIVFAILLGCGLSRATAAKPTKFKAAAVSADV